jgi:hypothetical protein
MITAIVNITGANTIKNAMATKMSIERFHQGVLMVSNSSNPETALVSVRASCTV